jgi:hypothetical protein
MNHHLAPTDRVSTASTPGRAMHALSDALPRDQTLLLVDFKWLMAGMGWWVDRARWRSDRSYARQCLANAMASDNACLRMRALEIVACGLV